MQERKKRAHLTNEDRTEIVAMYRAKKPMLEITTKFECTRFAVYKIVHNRGAIRKSKGFSGLQARNINLKRMRRDFGFDEIPARPIPIYEYKCTTPECPQFSVSFTTNLRRDEAFCPKCRVNRLGLILIAGPIIKS